MACKARQYSDQMMCSACGLQWDVTDPEPPACLTPKAPPSSELELSGRRPGIDLIYDELREVNPALLSDRLQIMAKTEWERRYGIQYPETPK
jgi:hypothetical protein